jgi:hypothetical protein
MAQRLASSLSWLIRRGLPTATLIIVGLCVLGGRLLEVELAPNFTLRQVGDVFVDWASILFAFALLLGLLNLAQAHLRRIQQRTEDWSYSVILLVTMGLVLLAGLSGPTSTSLHWIFRHVITPLQATLLSLMVFFIVSAAWRMFRMRSLGTFIMLVTAIIILLGQMPLGERFGLEFAFLKQWILDVPNLAGQRGILLGVALGTVVTGVRLLLGINHKQFFS